MGKESDLKSFFIFHFELFKDTKWEDNVSLVLRKCDFGFLFTVVPDIFLSFSQRSFYLRFQIFNTNVMCFCL